nr:MAG TPA: hypothetical protein [Caudoviricetes sp.]
MPLHEESINDYVRNDVHGHVGHHLKEGLRR